MLPNYDLVEKMKEEYGEKIACISIGPAGEMKMAAASIAFTDMELRPTRHAGRGGVGAVMGAKGVKVIVLDDAGMKMRPPKDPEKFKEANKKFVEGLRKHPVTGQGLPAYGTNVLTNILNEAGGYPTYNFKEGRFDGAAKISGETQAETGDQPGRVGHPRLPSRLRHPLFRDLQRQGWQFPDQTARIRDGLGPRRQLRHLRPGRHRHAGFPG